MLIQKVQTKVSIILTTKDRPLMLRRAIQGVIDQTFESWELIVIDDGSSCNNEVIVQSFDSEKIRYHKNVKSQGVSAARNQGIELANAPYISLLDDDDVYLPTFLSESIRCLDNSSENVGFCWSDILEVFFDEEGNEIWSKPKRYKNEKNKDRSFVDIAKVGASYGVTFKSEFFQKFGLYDTTLTNGEDTELFMRFLARGVEAVPIGKVLLRYSHHQKGHLSKDYASMIKNKVAEKLIKEHGAFYINYPLTWTFLHFWQGATVMKAGERSLGNEIIKKCWRDHSIKNKLYVLYQLVLSSPSLISFYFHRKKVNSLYKH